MSTDTKTYPPSFLQQLQAELEGVDPAPTHPLPPAAELLQWIDATQRTPDTDTTVLCWAGDDFFCGYWDDSLPGWIACESGGSVLGVTHWAEPAGPT